MIKGKGDALDLLHLINLRSISWKVFLAAEVALWTSPAIFPQSKSYDHLPLVKCQSLIKRPILLDTFHEEERKTAI